MNEWGFGFSFLISTHGMLSLFLNNTTTKELVMKHWSNSDPNLNIHGINFSIYHRAKTITIHAKGITLVASSFCTGCSTWVLVLQILWEQLQSIYSALKFFQILYTYTAEVIKRIKTASHLQRLILQKVLLRIWFSNFY